MSKKNKAQYFLTVQVLGVHFFKGKVSEVFDYLFQNGGLMTVPAAPALVTIKEDKAYYEALLGSNIVIPDSGFMILIWNLLRKNKLKKISGLEFINFFTEKAEEAKKQNIFLVNPSDKHGTANTEYLCRQGFGIKQEHNYTAPFYGNNVADFELLKKIEEQKPKWILINIGGGTQEKLGLFLKENLSYNPAVLCTGAAIAFKTGQQAKMPGIVDYFYLGWLHRCLSNPRVFVPRYIKGFRLFPLIWKYRDKKVA